MNKAEVRNIAIIAHVDHGKTTLVDGLMKASGTFREGEQTQERAMDSGDLERERGITILSKCTSITWNGIRINLVDTPGHADFGGEVERVLGMVDAVLLVVDAFEGPMPQTRFVTQKAFELGLKPIVCVNKIDRPRCDPDGAIDHVFDLFGNLGATDDQLDFPVVYASAKLGYAKYQLEDDNTDLLPLLETIVKHVPPAQGDKDAPFTMQTATLAYDDFLGYLAIGRVKEGSAKVGDRLLLARSEDKTTTFRVQKILGFQGVKRFEVETAQAGDIVAITGMNELFVGDTITDVATPTIMPPMTVDAPTLSMVFTANDSPFAGKEGKFVTSRNVKERLERELKSNISLKVEPGTQGGSFRVSGRGELHLSILIETMRREGFELCISQPRVIMKTSAEGKKQEPFEHVVAEMEADYSGPVIEELGRRLAQMTEMRPMKDGRTHLEFLMPSRGLIGYRSQFLTDTRGTGVMYTQFAKYDDHAGSIRSRINGVLISQDRGESNAYALFSLQDRGILFIGTQVPVYGGMIIGQHAKDNDLVVNPCKAKKLTNFRTTAADEKLVIAPPREMTLEKALEYINEDELVEVTPSNIRLRKVILDHNERKRAEKSKG